MDDPIAKSNVQANNNSIAIGEINISGTVTGDIRIGHTIIQAADAKLRHDLSILLKNVQTTWIKGVLERSVYEAALLDLGMEIREEAVENPWRIIMESPDQTRENIPRGRGIKDLFHEANGLLLILGEPGSGKTTTLLQLARDLIAEVDPAFMQPVPVILNLSTWTNKEQLLDAWLVAELSNKYRVPKKDGQRWLEGRRILPLLDGLDEVKAENRAACVEKINQLVNDYGLQAVVCSRIKDYNALNVRLGFYRAIYIQPLTPEQVDEYLERAGEKLASLRATLQADKALKDMAQSPLILNIMSLAYQNTSAEALSDPALNTNEARRRYLFDTYIARMFKRKSGERLYDDEQTKDWLSWLARNLQRHNQDIFLIENLQPSWLSTRHWQWVYLLVSRLCNSVWFWTMLVWLTTATATFGLGKASMTHLGNGFLVGIGTGLIVSLIDILRFEWIRKRPELKKSPNWGCFGILIVGTVVCITAYLTLLSINIFVIDARLYALAIGLLSALIFGRRGGSRQSIESDIQTVEALPWSWRRAARGGLIGALIGPVLTLPIVLSESNKLADVIYGALPFAVYGAFFGIVFSGLRREIVETKSRPNEGIRLSIRNSLRGGLVIGLGLGLFGLTSLLTGLTLMSYQEILFDALLLALIGGIIGILWNGGFDVIQHYILRFLLTARDNIPRNYARFLDYAVDHIFLQKIGGGYRFIHRLLLEHFADMGETTKKV